MNCCHIFAITVSLVLCSYTVRGHGLTKSSGDILDEESNSERGGRVKRNIVRDRRKLWKNGEVPYSMSHSITSRPSYVKLIKEAMAEWEQHTCIRFKKRTNERSYAHFFYGYGCYARVGAAPYRGQTFVSLGRRCNDFGVIVHELGHVLGFLHEQNRPDRDKYVRILWNNIRTGARREFARAKTRWTTTLGFPYDYKSVMHYGKYVHSKNRRPTIQSRDRSVKMLGGRHLSKIDIMEANVLYNCWAYPEFPKDFSLQSRVPKGQRCLAISEPRNRDWRTKYLCYPVSRNVMGLEWSDRGKLWGRTCTKIQLKNKPSSWSWNNNYLCYPPDSIYRFYWSADRPYSGMNCLRVTDEVKRKNYYLCARKRSGVKKPVHGRWTQWSPWKPCSTECGGGEQTSSRSCTAPQNGGKTCKGQTTRTRSCNTQACLSWSSWTSDFRLGIFRIPPSRMNCITIFQKERFRLCWAKQRRALSPRVSDSGNIVGMFCTTIPGPSDSIGNWARSKNLCLPNHTPYRLVDNGFQVFTGRQAKWKCLSFGRTLKGREKSYLCARPKIECPSSWIPFRQEKRLFCYHKLDFPLTWPAAQKRCQGLGANLASITSRREGQFLSKVANGIYRWIGFNDRRREGTMEWVDGSPVTYTNWSRGDPNDGAGRKNEDCAMINSGKGEWEDWPCSTKFNALCKITAG